MTGSVFQRSDVRDQMSEIRCQRSDVRDQMSEIRCQMSEDRKSEIRDLCSGTGFEQKWSWLFDHGTEHRTHFLTFSCQTAMTFNGDVFTISCKIKPSVRFTVFSISPSCMLLYEQEAASVNLLIKCALYLLFAPSGFQLVKLTAQRARSPVENSSSHFNRFPLDFLRLNSFQRAWFLVSQRSQAMSNHGRSLWVDFTCPLLCMANLFSRSIVWPI